MKKTLFMIATTLFLCITTTSASTITPEQFLETLSDVDHTGRLFVSNVFLTVGIPFTASSLLLKDEDNKSEVISLGSLYTGVGLAFRLIPFEIETKYKKFKSDPNISALDAVKELKKSQTIQRYIASALVAIPLFFDFSGTKTVSNPHPEDANISVKTLSASASIGMLLFQTPLEQLCENIINQETNKTSIKFEPSLEKIAISATYQF